MDPHYATLPEEGLREIARAHRGACDDGTVDPDDLDWRLVDLEVSLLLGCMPDGDWAGWLASEIEDAGPERASDWPSATDGDDVREPIVVVMLGGMPEIWDGWHRTAVAAVRSDRSVPAILGTPSLRDAWLYRAEAEAVRAPWRCAAELPDLVSDEADAWEAEQDSHLRRCAETVPSQSREDDGSVASPDGMRDAMPSDGRRKAVQNEDSTMSDQDQQPKTRKFSPIFNAPVTPTGEMEESSTRKGVAYGKFPGEVEMKGGKTPRTIMAFGDQLAAVRDAIVVGKTVEFAVQRDGGTIKLIGFPREKAAA